MLFIINHHNKFVILRNGQNANGAIFFFKLKDKQWTFESLCVEAAPTLCVLKCQVLDLKNNFIYIFVQF